MFNLRQGVFMTNVQPLETKRKRAPSKRALETKARVFDAAEKIFAISGYDGATIRDIAAQAGEPVGTIHHHGGGKKALFHQTVARRSDTLSRVRLAALDQAKSADIWGIEGVIAAFMRPFFDLLAQDPAWRDYARLVAFVSSDDRWRGISAECFDPTAQIFLAEFQTLLPHASKQQVAEGFAFSVAAMLALLTSKERIGALGAGHSTEDAQIDRLIAFCAAGIVV
jgi:AcrR family transcriptional regulator